MNGVVELIPHVLQVVGELPEAWRWAPKAFYFAAFCASAGALWTYQAALRPAARNEPVIATRLATRTATIGAICVAFLAPALLLQTGSRIARATEISFGAALAPDAMWRYLTSAADDGEWVGDGQVALIKLVAALLAAGALAACVRMSALPTRRVNAVIVSAASLMLATSLIDAVPRSSEDLKGEALLGSLFDQMHVLGGAAWLGGLLLLALVTTRHRAIPDATVDFWSDAWRRFSLVATISVAAISTSGIWLAWKHMGSLSEFFTTAYGLVLLVKVFVVAALIGLGAWNQLAVLPRLVQLRREGHSEPALMLAVRHLGTIVKIEVALGFAVLITVGLLSGSARKQAGDGAAVLTVQIWGWGAGFVVATVGLMWLTGRVATFLASRPLPQEA